MIFTGLNPLSQTIPLAPSPSASRGQAYFAARSTDPLTQEVITFLTTLHQSQRLTTQSITFLQNVEERLYSIDNGDAREQLKKIVTELLFELIFPPDLEGFTADYPPLEEEYQEAALSLLEQISGERIEEAFLETNILLARDQRIKQRILHLVARLSQEPTVASKLRRIPRDLSVLQNGSLESEEEKKSLSIALCSLLYNAVDTQIDRQEILLLLQLTLPEAERETGDAKIDVETFLQNREKIALNKQRKAQEKQTMAKIAQEGLKEAIQERINQVKEADDAACEKQEKLKERLVNLNEDRKKTSAQLIDRQQDILKRSEKCLTALKQNGERIQQTDQSAQKEQANLKQQLHEIRALCQDILRK